ncbi:putative lipoprotein [Pseudoalteromonas luteoviolacea B = ATCC 29581]|nr:putative lipoprotein [Pseudoalteromonas luteoviolacea B = ATCC 29581]
MKSIVTLALVTTLLVGCTAPLRTVILSPAYPDGFTQKLNKTIKVDVLDHRASKFSIKVIDQEPQIYLPHSELPVTVKEVLTTALLSQNAKIDDFAPTKITLVIKSLSAQVRESMSQHSSDAYAEFEVRIDNGQRQFTKVFTGKGELNGPLKHEQSKIEAQLNSIIVQTVQRIMRDSEIATFLQE